MAKKEDIKSIINNSFDTHIKTFIFLTSTLMIVKQTYTFKISNFCQYCNFYSHTACKLKTYNLGHNIFRIFDVLPNFPFTTSETNCDY